MLYNKIKSAFKYILYTLLFVVFISCGNEDKNQSTDQNNKENRYGGVFKMNNEFEFRSLYPLSLTETVGHRICNQVYESLVDLNPKDLTVRPALAKSWDISNDAKTFTFYLRKGVYFHDDPCFPNSKGRELTAQDIKYCFDKLCEYSSLNQMFWLVQDKIKGANEYYQLSRDNKPLPKNGVEGIKVIDDYTIQIELEFPFAILPTVLTHSAFWIYPHEAFEKYKDDMRIHMVGTGPFKPKKIKEGEAVILVKNENYWKKDSLGNQLPYLDGIKFSFIHDNEVEFLSFKKGDFDFTLYNGVFAKEIQDDIKNKRYKLYTTQALGVNYIAFNCTIEPFNNPKVRKAFQLALDINKISPRNSIIKGIVPPMKNYPFFKLNTPEFDPLKARKLLKESGYDLNKFPEITIHVSTDGDALAQILQKLIKDNLGLDIIVQPMPYNKLSDFIEQGKAQLWTNGWLADYPDPENFLNLFYGKNVPDNPNERSFINSCRYKSEKFDHYFEMALKSVNIDERNNFYRLADQTIIDEVPAIAHNYSVYSGLYHNYVKNFYINGMKYFKFEQVFLDKSEK
jgi:peptide/nickel transport system substrate-binding protein